VTSLETTLSPIACEKIQQHSV